ncbi:MAG: hybrid sensor histidine kinase/response regulator, partial [Desulfurivibrionaceae bacterium]|nr:hybrid sensor histidine kinase/response regulator [Desulfurivibrionaceae bacterium]
EKIPIADADGRVTGLVGFSMDITERRHAEEQLRQAQKMEAVGTLVGGIAHDFNNMLAAIKANVYLARVQPKNESAVMERLANIEQVATGAAEMVQQLLAFARKDIASTSVLSLSDFMREGVKLARAIIPENIHCRVDICSEDLVIRGDATQLQQVLMNLLNNARDAVAGVAVPEIGCSLAPYTADPSF